MSYLIEFHWVWLLIAWVLGLIVGWLTYQRVRRRWMDGLVWLVLIAVAIAAFVAITTVVLGRPGYLLDVAVLLVIAYFIGCPLGWALRHMAFVDPVSAADTTLVPRPGYTFPDGMIDSVPATWIAKPAPAATATADSSTTPDTKPPVSPVPSSSNATVAAAIKPTGFVATLADGTPSAASPVSAPTVSTPTVSTTAATPGPGKSEARAPKASTSPISEEMPASASTPSTQDVQDVSGTTPSTPAGMEPGGEPPAAVGTTPAGPSESSTSTSIGKTVSEATAAVPDPSPATLSTSATTASSEASESATTKVLPSPTAHPPPSTTASGTPEAVPQTAAGPDDATAAVPETTKPGLATAGPDQQPASSQSPSAAAPSSKDPPPPPAAVVPPPADTRSPTNTMPPLPDQDRHPGTRPDGLMSARDNKADDLKRIKGIGLQNEGRLHGLGVWHFDQIAAWTPDNVKWVGSYLAFHGRIDREKWIDQAKALASGLQTEFSKRVAAGKVATSMDDGSLGQKNVAETLKPGPRKR